MIEESFTTQPLAQIIPSYCYFQYADDVSVQAFVSSYNSITQSYLDWFINTPLSVYTSPAISGLLLDWTASSVYGYPRPFLITAAISGRVSGGYGFSVFGESAYGKRRGLISPGVAQAVSDDVYKRALTWQLYLGDGKQMSITWLKRRIARFLYGANGSDISVDYLQNINLSFTTTSGDIGYLGSRAFFGACPFGVCKYIANTHRQISVTLPTSPASVILQSLIKNGFLSMPFQANVQILLTGTLDSTFVLGVSTLA